MKKFFRALALVLALVLVIGTIPASAAEGTSDIKLKKKTKIIYLKGSQGIAEDGTKCKTPSRYKVSKLVKGFDSKKMDITLKSADKSIVKTSSKKDKIYAKGLGTTTVEIFVNNLDGQQLADLKLKVRVKKSATEIGDFAVTDAEGNAVDLTANKAGLNQPYFVTFVHEKDTDYRDLAAADESVTVEKVDALVPGGQTFKVTFTKSGTFTLTASVYQSAEWPGKRLETPVPVIAGYDVAAVEQSALDAIRVTFKTPVTGIDKTAFKAYYEINGVKIYPSDVDTVTPDANDKNVVIVKFLAPFLQGQKYFVQYDNGEEPVGSFDAITPKKDSVKQIIITTTKVTAGELTDIKYQLLDEKGIDITSGVASLGQFKFEMTEGDPINNYITTISPYKVYMAKADEVITVKGTYTYYDDANNAIPISNEVKILAVAPEAYSRGAASGVIVASDKELIDGNNALVDGVKDGIAWTMDAPVAYFQVYVPYTKSTGTAYEGFGNAKKVGGEFDSYSIKVADETVALYKGMEGNKAKLEANKAGTTSIIIYGHKNADNSDTVVGAANVTVIAKRVVGSYTVSADNNKRDLNTSYAGDKVTFKFDVKDQDGKDFELEAPVTVTCTSKDVVDLTKGGFTYKKGGTTSFEITPADVKLGKDKDGKDLTSGTLTIKFTINNIDQVVNVSVAKAGDAERYVLSVGPNSLDTGIVVGTAKDGVPAVTIKLNGIAKDGYTASGTSISYSDKALQRTTVGEYKGAYGYVFTITKDGKLVDGANVKIQNMTTDGTAYTVAAFSNTGASGTAIKLDKALYVVTAYKVSKSATATKDDMIDIEQLGASQSFTVSDNQKMPEVKKNSKAESLESLKTSADIAKAFDVTFDGKKVGNGDGEWKGDVTVEFIFKENGNTAYVSEAKVTINNAKTGAFTITVPVDTLVKKGN